VIAIFVIAKFFAEPFRFTLDCGRCSLGHRFLCGSGEQCEFL
jgi:hypothetical protein